MLSTQKTFMAKPRDLSRKWYVVDAEGKRLGKVAVTVANLLRGKTKPEYTPGVDSGDFVIVVNAEKVEVSGRKPEQKLYYRHSGYPRGLKATSLGTMLKTRPERVIELAVRGMMPRNRLGRAQLRKLHVYAGPLHPHQAQQPEPVEF